MSINLKEAVDFLLSGGYLTRGATGRYKVTQKLYDQLMHPEIIKDLELLKPVVINGKLAYMPPGELPLKMVDWVSAYTSFIVAARIPARGESKSGEYYPMNKYSNPGMKAFRKIIEAGVDLDILIKSTMLYYKSGVKLKVAITRYMEDGLWRSDYEALVNSAEEGKVEEHIKQQLNDGQHTDWTVG